ncbi:NRDE protein-domain-containing protein [Phascolomyces articulosus]|uniref:NRDE protein-domain-containing protein n=1 Tax=Phascolomyces articulosus TaxID=60185 RepID=A0AAD5K1W8_9FUNG|nr:NRDE protein-domain-containing protein [Phascolomyces articulosus]
MCILFWTVDNHPRYRFIFAANRDEFLDRPTAHAHFWPTPHEDILAGTDLEAQATPLHNGTWLGITRSGRFSALTNYREQKFLGGKSRGALTRDYLFHENGSAHDYMENIKANAKAYGGFNLICLDLTKERQSHEMAYFSNRENSDITDLSPGVIYGLSNSVLGNPWEKVKQGKKAFDEIIQRNLNDEEALIDQLFGLLSVTADPPPSSDQDVSQILEEVKHWIFVPKFEYLHGAYATRTSTVILVDHDGNTTFIERDRFQKRPQNHTAKEEDEVLEKYIPLDEKGRVFRFNIDDPSRR